MQYQSLAKSYRQALDRVLANLTAGQRTLKEIAEASGVPYGTVKNIANGVIKEPSVLAVDALDRTLSKRNGNKH